MILLKQRIETTFHNGPSSGVVADRWKRRSILVRQYAGNNTWEEMQMNLHELATRILSTVVILSNDTGLAATYQHDPHWRFVIDNSLSALLPAFQDLLGLLDAEVENKFVLYVPPGGCACMRRTSGASILTNAHRAMACVTRFQAGQVVLTCSLLVALVSLGFVGVLFGMWRLFIVLLLVQVCGHSTCSSSIGIDAGGFSGHFLCYSIT